jgi:AcrR family transcriptional regulator
VIPPDTTAARERLVDAAERCIDRFGLAKTTLEDVAAEASVSRATIYRYFANRDELMLEVLLRELARSFEFDLDDFVNVATTPEEFASAIVESSAYLLATIRENAKIQLLLNQEGNTVAATVAGAGPAMFIAISEDLLYHLVPAQTAGLIRPQINLHEAAEWIIRSILSLITVEGPVHRSIEDEKRFLATFLVPAIVQLPTPTTGQKTPTKAARARAARATNPTRTTKAAKTTRPSKVSKTAKTNGTPAKRSKKR